MILVLRALGVGDLATAVPALRALRAAYPGDRIALAAPAWLAPLVDLVGGVDRVVPTDGLGRLDPSVGRPAVAVNLHGRGPASHRMLAATRPGRLLAFANAEAGHHDGPDWDDGEHEVDRWCRLLRAYRIAADPGDLALRRPPPDRVATGVTVVHPGSKVPAKRWPAERFAAVAGRLAAAGHRVVVTGDAAEVPLARRVARLAGLPADVVLAGRTDLGELAALVAHARLVVCGDTGVGHLATGYRTPSVLLFGPVSPARWGPPADRPWHRVLWAGEGSRRGPEGVESHPTMVALPVGEVLVAVDDVQRTARVSGAVAA
ncbi:glycosyltransferase family 9 protein [Micromonospora endolithica]|uniref:Glycosyltransferase family 9 protein n=1 Tax=Micromonospora endolithica TaxID=230091 RepID=A0A3A9YVW5_9ACTN|nr:glycosyltransferase family 9 protein [Micromonospora endolithica]RKN39376.1 glycosyltransferase family 9 protein [Micromonospora endolithica]TWJ22698.1 ADP-heptose:LPS heptosyltransferase [Micromonospora endolithica]